MYWFLYDRGLSCERVKDTQMFLLLWLYLIILPRTNFRANPHPNVCPNVKEIFARSRRHIWSLSDSNGIWTHRYLVCKRTLNHLAKLAKWLRCVVSHYLQGAFDFMLLSCTYEFQSETTLWKFFYIQVSIECRFTLKLVRDMTITCSQMHGTDNYSQHSSNILPVWLNGWVFVYKLSGCGFESSCCHLNFRYEACFKQRAPWYSGKL